MSHKRTFAVLIGLTLLGAALQAQTPAKDPSERLREVLPADVAAHVLAKIAAARAHGLPAAALENRALKFAAKGVDPTAIERSVDEQADRMENAKDVLEKARGKQPDDDEVEAGAEVLRRGVDGQKVSELAKSAPSGRSLAVPLFVIGSLVDRGLPSDEALQRVLARLQARASDADLEHLPKELPAQAVAGQNNRPGGAPGASTRPGNANGAGPSQAVPRGPPSGVPANGGRGARPTEPPGSSKGTRRP